MHGKVWMKSTYMASETVISGVARAIPGGRLAHPESQNEEKNK